MAVYSYDITPTEVITQRLRFANSVSNDVLEVCINKAAGLVNQMLTSHGITSTSIVDVPGTEEDYENLRNLVMVGAAAYAQRSDTGAYNDGASQNMVTEFNVTLKQYQDNPQLLQSYNQLTDASNGVRSTGNATAENTRRSDAARCRAWDPSNPRRRRM